MRDASVPSSTASDPGEVREDARPEPAGVSVAALQERLSDLEVLRSHAAGEADAARSEIERSRNEIASLRSALRDARAEANAASSELERVLSRRLAKALRRAGERVPPIAHVQDRVERVRDRLRLA